MYRTLDRRRFLLASATAIAIAACGPAQSPALPRASEGSVSSRNVVVIGAGLSGLVIALDLIEHGFDPLVLEASMRPGGRIHTLREPFGPGFYVEAGATFVVADPDLVKLLHAHNIEIAKRKPRNKGLSRVVLRGNERLVIPPGGAVPEPYQLTPEEENAGPFGPTDKYFPELRGVDITGVLPNSMLAYDTMSATEYLRKKGASDGYMAMVREALVPNRPLENTSALSLMREMGSVLREMALEPLPGDRIVGGSDRLPTALANKLGKRVIYGAHVKRIDQSGQQVSVSFMRNGQLETVNAARVVSTLQSTVLRDIEFQPGLSDGKMRALKELGLVSVTRVWMGTKERIWDAKNESGFVDNHGPMGRIRHETEAQDGPGGVLGVYTTGAEARRLAGLNEKDRLADALGVAERAHPGLRAQFTVGASKCWDDDPLQKGAYGEYGPGQLTTLVPELAKVEGRLHFAGDQTSHRPAFMHGALASARRVVQEILQQSKP